MRPATPSLESEGQRTRDRNRPKRIRIFFINCPTLATDAATFLLLSQNDVQSTIQFEVHHFWLYSLKSLDRISRPARWISDHEDNLKRMPILGSLGNRLVQKNRSKLDLRVAPCFSKTLDPNPDTLWPKLRSVIKRYDSWVKGRQANNYDSEPAPSIIVTESRFLGNYISSWDTEKEDLLVQS